MPDMEKLELEYPCEWGCRIIGEHKEKLEEAAAEIMGNRKYILTPSNRSSGGKYISLNITFTVENEEERLSYTQMFKDSPAVKLVL